MMSLSHPTAPRNGIYMSTIIGRNMRSASLNLRCETVSIGLNVKLCRNELDLDPRPSRFGDLFQGLERKALVLAALDPRNRLLAGAHKLRQLLLR